MNFLHSRLWSIYSPLLLAHVSVCEQCGFPIVCVCCEQLNILMQPAMLKIEAGEVYTLDKIMFWFYNEIVCRDKI